MSDTDRQAQTQTTDSADDDKPRLMRDPSSVAETAARMGVGICVA